jgi:signal transduction histidine kinase
MRQLFRRESISSLTIILGIVLTSGLIIALPQYPKRLALDAVSRMQSQLSQKISAVLTERINGLRSLADLYADGVIKNSSTHAYYARRLMDQTPGLEEVGYVDRRYKLQYAYPGLNSPKLSPEQSPDLYAVAKRALETQSLVISDPITLPDRKGSYLIALIPIVGKGGGGLVEGVFSSHTITRDVINPLLESDMPYQLENGDGIIIGGQHQKELEAVPPLIMPIDIGGTQWTLRFPASIILQHAGVRIYDWLTIPYNWLTLMFGLGIIAVLTFGTLGLNRQSKKLEQKNQEIARLYETIQFSLQQTEDEYRRIEMILESVPAGVCVIEAESGKVVIANRNATTLFGQPLTSGTVVPILSESYALCQPSGEPYPLADLPIGKAVLGGISSVTDDVTLVRPDGEKINLLMGAAPISTSEDQATQQIVLVFQDITEKVKLEQQLQHYTGHLESEVRRRTRELEQTERELRLSYEQLKQTQERLIEHERLSAIGKMSATIAHEIRNPLSALHAAAQELKEGLDLPEEYQELLEIITSQSTRLSKIIQNTLTFTRPISLEKNMVDIHTVIDRLLVSLRGDSRFQNGIQLSKQYSSDLPSLLIDPDAIEQVLWNILLNAVQAIRHNKGQVQVLTKWLPNGLNGFSNPCVEISVTDNGVGIPTAQLSKIFEPFHTTKAQGTGLGLAVARRIIEAHGGAIKADSQIDRGTTMKILLPVEQDSGRTLSSQEKR